MKERIWQKGKFSPTFIFTQPYEALIVLPDVLLLSKTCWRVRKANQSFEMTTWWYLFTRNSDIIVNQFVSQYCKASSKLHASAGSLRKRTAKKDYMMFFDTIMIHDEWIITVQSWTYYEAEWSQEQAKCSADHDAGVTTCFSKTFYATKAFSWMCAMSLTRDWIDLNLAACRRTVGPRWAWALLKVGDSLRTSLSASSLYTGGAGLQTEPCKSQFLVQRSSEAEGPVYWVQELSQLLWASK